MLRQLSTYLNLGRSNVTLSNSRDGAAVPKLIIELLQVRQIDLDIFYDHAESLESILEPKEIIEKWF